VFAILPGVGLRDPVTRSVRNAAGGLPAASKSLQRTRAHLARVALASLVAGAVTLCATDAWADVFGVFGAGAQDSAMAGAGAAITEDARAVHTSPAGMSFGIPSVTLGFMGAANRLVARLSPRPSGYDAPDLGSASPVIPYANRLRARPAEAREPGVSGFTVGAVAGLGLDWLRAGVLVFIPTTGVANQSTFYPDEREQYFSNTVHRPIYGARLSSQQILFATAARPLAWMSVAAGLRFLLETHANTSVLIPDQADTSVQYVDLRTRVGAAAGVTGGAAARFFDDRLRISATFRDEVASTTRGTNEIQIRGFQNTAQFPIEQPNRYVVEFLPRQVSVGSAYASKLGSIALDATWSQWSRYLDDLGEHAGFHDTVSAAAGGELVLGARTPRLRAGIGYRASPVPPQTGRTNHVDNGMWILGLGSACNIRVDGHDLEIAFFGQLQLAVRQTTVKDDPGVYPACEPGVASICDEVPDGSSLSGTNHAIAAAAGLQTGNPGFPGFSSGGWVAVAGLQLTWRYQ